MNILFVTWFDPRRTSNGAEQRSRFLWTALKQIGDVQTVVVRQKRHGVIEDDAANRVRTVGTNSPWLPLAVLDHLFARIADGCWLPWHARRTVLRLVGRPGVKYDVVVCRYLAAVALTSAWKIAPCFVDVDDYPPAFAQSRGLSRWKRAIISWWTRHLLRRCRGAWIPDAAQIPLISRFTPCLELSNLAMEPSPGYRRDAPRKRQLMTVGHLRYEPNREGVDWFLANVWPALRERFPDLRYVVAGGGAPAASEARWRAIPGVEVRGFVDDLDGLYAESLAVVAPILTGAGTCIKVAEAALHGRKILATPFAVRGLDAARLRALDVTVSECAADYVAALEGLMAEDGAARRDREARTAAAAREANDFEGFARQVRRMVGG